MKKVLIISRPSVIITSLQKYLEEKGDIVQLISSGTDGLKYLFEEKYDLLLSSVDLEGVDGVQLLKILKSSNSFNTNIETVMLTSGESIEKIFSNDNRPDFILIKDQNLLNNFDKIYLKTGAKKEAPVKILYIDDDKFVQKMVKLWLSKEGNIHLTQCDSVASLQGIEEKDFDLIVSDNILGDGEFHDVLKYLQSTELRGIPIIIYTGTVGKLNIEDLQRSGNIIDILPKPFEMSIFMQKVAKIKSLKS